MDKFDVLTENPDNISCFVYINDNREIEGRRMFYKGKQLLDHKVFPILTKIDEEIYYLYGFYGNQDSIANRSIIREIIRQYGNNIIYTDHGYLKDGYHQK